MLSFLYADLITNLQKNIARDSFNTGVKQLKSWLKCFTELRNKIAHFTRLYYWRFTSIPKASQGLENTMNQDKFFSQLLVLKYLYPNRKKWNEDFLQKLILIIKKYEDYISFEHIGFPDNWIDLLKKR